MTVRISDPRPAFCSACHNSTPGLRYVDFDAAHDSGAFVGREHQNYIEGSDDLHLCENCVRLATEVIGAKPELHARVLRENRRLEIAVEHWRDYSKTLEATLATRPEPINPRRGQKVAA